MLDNDGGSNNNNTDTANSQGRGITHTANTQGGGNTHTANRQGGGNTHTVNSQGGGNADTSNRQGSGNTHTANRQGEGKFGRGIFIAVSRFFESDKIEMSRYFYLLLFLKYVIFQLTVKSVVIFLAAFSLYILIIHINEKYTDIVSMSFIFFIFPFFSLCFTLIFSLYFSYRNC